MRVLLVAHTHWDREWYHAAGQFRQRLVALIDALLDAPVDAGRPFLLDGQAVVLEDYLALRPERAQDVADLLRSRALEAGPWYVLADGLIPSGEAIVRNLLAGRAVLGRLGVSAPPVAYCPDTFGHPAAMPLIAAGFGLRVGIVWRGLGGARVEPSDVYRWHAPNGDALLVYHLPPDGYEFGSALPVDLELARTRWHRIESVLGPRARLGVALLLNGADHHALQPDLDGATASLAAAASPSSVTRSSLTAFAVTLEHAAQGQNVPEIHGELRDSYGYTWALPGTLATRAAQKRNNAHTERLLLRDAEPWLVLAWLHGAPWAHRVATDARVTLEQAPALLDAAWRTLLRAHPHDTLCGCSLDAVARAMEARLESARSQAIGLRDAALAMALDHDVVLARSAPVAGIPQLVVRNRSATARGGIAEVRLVETIGDVPVGPGGAGWQMPSVGASARVPAIADAIVQPGWSRVEHARRESPQHYPDDDLVRTHYAVAWIPPVPPLGVRTFALAPSMHAGAPTALPPSLHPVTCHDNGETVVLDNGIVRVVASLAGVAIETRGRRIPTAFTLETTCDLGDAYTPSLRGQPESLALRAIRAGAMGPLRASVELHWGSGRGQSAIRAVTTCVLDATSAYLRIDVRGTNRRRDHRLRLHLHTDVIDPVAWADAAFGPVLRAPLSVPSDDQRFEQVPATMPLHRWVTASNAQRGATLISDGLAEAEVLRDGTIAVTLLRAIGELSRADLPERPGHAGWPCAIPLAQSRGAFRARLGFLAHGTWSATTRDDIECAASDLLLPLVGDTWRDLANQPAETSGVALNGQGLYWSACKLAADGDGIVLRCTNIHDHDVTGAWHLPRVEPMEWARARLDETLIDDWQAAETDVVIRVPARSVETLRVRRSGR